MRIQKKINKLVLEQWGGFEEEEAWGSHGEAPSQEQFGGATCPDFPEVGEYWAWVWGHVAETTLNIAAVL